MTDTITTVGFYQHRIEADTTEWGTVCLYRMTAKAKHKSIELIEWGRYSTRLERKFYMILLRVMYDTFNKTGYYFLLKPDDKN